MSKEVKRWQHITSFDENLQIEATFMALRGDGQFVMYEDYAELLSANADLDRLASQTAALNEKAGMRVYELTNLLIQARQTMYTAWKPATKTATDCRREILEELDKFLSQQAKP